MPTLTHELRVRFDEETYEWLRRRAFTDRVALAETIRACVEYAANNRYQRYSNDPTYAPAKSTPPAPFVAGTPATPRPRPG